jgi:hypothetical protein
VHNKAGTGKVHVHGATIFFFCCSLVLHLINAHSLFLLLPPIATHCFHLHTLRLEGVRGLGFRVLLLWCFVWVQVFEAQVFSDF